MYKPELFLEIEAAMAAPVLAAQERATRPVERAVARALEAGDDLEAIRLLNEMDMGAVERTVQRSLPRLLRMALVLGAAQITARPRDTMFASGEWDDGDVVEAAVALHSDMVGPYAKQSVVGRASEVVADWMAPDLGGEEDPDLLVRKAADPALVARLQQAFNAGTKVTASLGATLTTSRMVSYGFLAQAIRSGVTKFQLRATLDERTSDICEKLHGRTFDVGAAWAKADQVVRTRDVDTLKAIAPFVRGDKRTLHSLETSTDEELQLAGIMVPPFHPHCYVEGTRVFTRRGFVEFPDLTQEDEFLSINPQTRKTEWVRAVARQEREHDGEVCRLWNPQGSVNMMVTPDHSLFFDRRVDRGKAGRQWELGFGAMADIERQENKLYVTSDVDPGNGTNAWCCIPIEKACRFAGYYAAEGYMHHGWPVIVQHIPAKRARMEADTRACGDILRWSDRFCAKSINLQYIARTMPGRAHEKAVPQQVFDAPPAARRAFLDGLLLGDGSTREQECFGFTSTERTYTTSSPALRDGIIRLLIGLGSSASFDTVMPRHVAHKNGVYIAKHPQFIIRELSSARRAAFLIKEHYAGKVYDVTLERNHTLLIEYDGCIAWGSNCRTILVPVGDVAASEIRYRPADPATLPAAQAEPVIVAPGAEPPAPAPSFPISTAEAVADGRAAPLSGTVAAVSENAVTVNGGFLEAAPERVGAWVGGGMRENLPVGAWEDMRVRVRAGGVDPNKSPAVSFLQVDVTLERPLTFESATAFDEWMGELVEKYQKDVTEEARSEAGFARFLATAIRRRGKDGVVVMDGGEVDFVIPQNFSKAPVRAAANVASKLSVEETVGTDLRGRDPRVAGSRAAFSRWARTWTTATREGSAALKAYTSIGYRGINRALRAGDGDGSTREEKWAKALDAQFKGSVLREDVVVHRGINDVAAVVGEGGALEPGLEFTDAGLWSTSMNAATAQQFAGASRYLFRIRLRAGTPALPGKDAEMEIVLPPGRRWRVVGVSEAPPDYAAATTPLARGTILVDLEMVE